MHISNTFILAIYSYKKGLTLSLYMRSSFSKNLFRNSLRLTRAFINKISKTLQINPIAIFNIYLNLLPSIYMQENCSYFHLKKGLWIDHYTSFCLYFKMLFWNGFSIKTSPIYFFFLNTMEINKHLSLSFKNAFYMLHEFVSIRR